jgi:hypothetical protein
VTGPVTALASATITGRHARGQSAPAEPVAGGITDVGRIRLSAGKIGLIHCDYVDDIRASMLATGLVTNDDLVEINLCGFPAPTLEQVRAQLLDVGSVLVWSNFPFPDREGLGNVLADYVDQGGGVVLATYAFSDPWSIGGRIATAAYSPFTVTGNNVDPPGMLDLAASNTAHPIMDGVTAGPYFANGNYTNPGLNPGASLIAVDTAGNRVVAVNASGRIVGISIYPGYGDMGRLFANAVVFVR